MRFAITLATLLAASTPASAQLVVSADTGEGSYHIDVTTGQSTLLWTNHTSINALAVDESLRKVWLVSIFVLRDWDYYDPFYGVVGVLTDMQGFALGNGVLYGVRGVTPTIVSVDPAALTFTPIVVMPSDWRIGDLAFDHQSQRLYFPVVQAQTAPLGIYSIDPVAGGTPVFVAAFPPGYVRVNGLAIGAGKIWILEPGLPIRSFDPTSGLWSPSSLPNPLGSSPSGAMDWSGRLPLRFTYCTAKTSASGCAPAIQVGSGYASAGGNSAFTVEARGALNRSTGLLVYGLSGGSNHPFFGGTLCVSSPLRSPLQSSGGSPTAVVDCSGAWSIDLNAFASGQIGGSPKPALSQFGTTVHCQWIGRDRTDPSRVQLSDGLRYDVEL